MVKGTKYIWVNHLHKNCTNVEFNNSSLQFPSDSCRMDGIVHKDGILSQSKDRASGKANEKSASQSCSSQIMSHHNNQQEYFQKDSRQDTTIVQVHGKNVNQDDHGVQMNVKKSSTECIKEEKKKGRLRKKAVLRAVLNQVSAYALSLSHVFIYV